MNELSQFSESVWGCATGFVQYLASRLPENFAVDVFKSLIGSLVGAGLAFWFALNKDKLTRLQTRKAAGMLAVTTLARLLNDFVQVRAALAKNRAQVLAQQPQSPIWMQIKPLIWNYAENLRFNIESLTFIFEHKEGPAVFEKLLTVEIKYHDFFHLLREHRRVTEDAQDVLSKEHPDPNKEVPESEYVAALGFARVARMESLVTAILYHVDNSEKFYTDAADALPALLRKLFGKKGTIKVIPPNVRDTENVIA